MLFSLRGDYLPLCILISEWCLNGNLTFQASVFLFTGIVTVILIRTLRRDIAKYNSEDDLVSLPHY